MMQPTHYSVDRGTGVEAGGRRIETVIIVLTTKAGEFTFVMTKEDAIVLGMAIQEAGWDAKRIVDVKAGVGL